MALDASVPAPPASVGYAGTASDGLTQLDAAHALTPYDSAPDGHIVATEEVTPARGGAVTLALGFGRNQASGGRHGAPVAAHRRSCQAALKYLTGWVRYDAHLRRRPVTCPARRPGATAAPIRPTTCRPT